MLTVSPLPGFLDLPPVKPDGGGSTGGFAPLIARLLGGEIKTDSILPAPGEVLPVLPVTLSADAPAMPPAIPTASGALLLPESDEPVAPSASVLLPAIPIAVPSPRRFAPIVDATLPPAPTATATQVVAPSRAPVVPPAILVAVPSPHRVAPIVDTPVPVAPEVVVPPAILIATGTGSASPAATNAATAAAVAPPPIRFATLDDSIELGDGVPPAIDAAVPHVLPPILTTTGGGATSRSPVGVTRAALLTGTATTLPTNLPAAVPATAEGLVKLAVPVAKPTRAASLGVDDGELPDAHSPATADPSPVPSATPADATTTPIVPAETAAIVVVAAFAPPPVVTTTQPASTRSPASVDRSEHRPVDARPATPTPAPDAPPPPRSDAAAGTPVDTVAQRPSSLAAAPVAPSTAGYVAGPAPVAAASDPTRAPIHAAATLTPQVVESFERIAPPPVTAASPTRAASPTSVAPIRSARPIVSAGSPQRSPVTAPIASIDAPTAAPATPPRVATDRAPTILPPADDRRTVAPQSVVAPPAQPGVAATPVEIMTSPRARPVADAAIPPERVAVPVPVAVPTPANVAPVILPASQAFGAAIRRALADERKPAPARDDTGLGLTALAGAAASTAVHAAARTVAASDTTLDTALDTGDRRWPNAMAEQIEKLRDAADAQSTRIRLIPDALGPVDVAVRRDGDRVHVHFTAADAQTRQLLADAQPRLADAAETRGLKLGRTEVSGGDQTPGDRQQQQRQPAPTPQSPRPAPARTRAAPADDIDPRPTTLIA